MSFVLKLLFTFFCFFVVEFVWAQSTYTDYNPQYKTWANTYQIDKIEQTGSEFVVHFRFARDNSKYDNPSFYPYDHEFAWVLETKNGTVYRWNRLSNIARNGVVQVADLHTEIQVVEAFTKEKKSKTFFTCQIHFQGLPDTLTEISLIQGKGLRENRNHLNCLDIQLKKQSNGSVGIEKERAAAFEKLMLTPQPLLINSQEEEIIAQKPTRVWSLEELNLGKYWSQDIQKYLTTSLMIDAAPVYEKWQETYFLDGVVNTPTETIFLLRIIFKKGGNNTDAIFYPKSHTNSWFVEDVSTGQKYSLKGVTNIRKNGKMMRDELSYFEYKIRTDGRTETVFTCQVHFAKLPNKVKEVNLVEGLGQETNKNHFNFFKIKIKQS